MDILRQLLAVLLSTVGAACLCSAADITYDVNLTIGAGSLTGDIVTDGTIGTLNAQGNVLDWNLLLNDGTTGSSCLTPDICTFDLVGPQGFVGEAFGSGTDLSATATQLKFDFSGTDDGYFIFRNR